MPGSVGAQRPGGRTARTRIAVFAALQAELFEHGYSATTVERIAQRAGVAKTTVYRRWGRVDGIVLDLLRELASTGVPLTDTGDFDQDLLELAVGIARFYENERQRLIVEVVVAAGVHDPRARATVKEFFRVRTGQAAELARRAIARGDLPPTTDPVEVIRAMAAPFYYHIFITGEPVDESVARRAATIAAHAARTGLLPSTG